MAMSEASLLTRLKNALGVAATAEGQAIQDDVLGKIAGAVIAEITQNGVITTTVTGTATIAGGSSAGVHPVTGTGAGTIA